METIKIKDYLKIDFAENKDIAKKLREEILLPALAKNKAVTFDFDGIAGATQSFIHALISEAIRRFPEQVFDNVFYKNTNPEIQQIITIVYRYMQESV